MNMSHPAAAADTAHSSTDAGVPRYEPWSLPSQLAFSYRSVACVDSDHGAGVGAVVGCLVFLVRFPLTTAHKRQRVRCRRMAE